MRSLRAGLFLRRSRGRACFLRHLLCLRAERFLGVWLEVQYNAPLWVHLLVTGPFMLLTCIPPLRPLKGWLVASQYFYKAEEGRVARRAAAAAPESSSETALR